MYGVLVIVVMSLIRALVSAPFEKKHHYQNHYSDSLRNEEELVKEIRGSLPVVHPFNSCMIDFSNLSIFYFDKKDSSLIEFKNKITTLAPDQLDSVKKFSQLFIEFALNLQKDEIQYLAYQEKKIKKPLSWSNDTQTLYDSLKSVFYFDQLGIYESNRKNEITMFVAPFLLNSTTFSFEETTKELVKAGKIDAHKTYKYLYKEDF